MNSDFAPHPHTCHADITPLDGPVALATLSTDLEAPGPCLLWLFLCDEIWLATLFAPHLKHSSLQILSDHRQRSSLRSLINSSTRAHVATWATNRTMHDKTLVLPELNVAYLTTANITRGSWTKSQNSFLRVESPAFAAHLTEAFHSQWRAARPLLRSEQ